MLTNDITDQSAPAFAKHTLVIEGLICGKGYVQATSRKVHRKNVVEDEGVVRVSSLQVRKDCECLVRPAHATQHSGEFAGGRIRGTSIT